MTPETGASEVRSHRAAVTRTGSAYPRRKVGAACQVCRARRTKCDNERPCSFCRKAGIQCDASPVSANSPFDAASTEILKRIADVQRDLTALTNGLQSSLHSGDHAKQAEVIQHISPSYSTSSVPSSPIPHEWQPVNLDSVLAWPVWSPTTPPAIPTRVTQSVTQALSAASPTTLDESLDHTVFPVLIDNFFNFVHVKNPVLDEKRIRSQMTGLLFRGPGWGPDSCLLLLILANGAMASPFTADLEGVPAYQRTAVALFRAAQKRLGSLIDAEPVLQAECYFYSGVFLMASLLPFEAWRMFLQGMAVCQSFVLPDQARYTDDAQRGAKESVYWSCWKSERELRLELDFPDFKGRRDDHPLMFPCLPQDCNAENLAMWYFYLAEISLWRIQMHARNSIEDFVTDRPQASLEELAVHVQDLQPPLQTWLQSLPEAIRFQPDSMEHETNILCFVLRGRLSYNVEVLTWPFVIAAINGDCHGTHAFKLALEGIHMHLDRLKSNRPGFTHRHHGTWLMQRSSARSACILLLCAQSLPQNMLPDHWQDAVLSTIEMLEYWHSGDGAWGEIARFMRVRLAALS